MLHNIELCPVCQIMSQFKCVFVRLSTFCVTVCVFLRNSSCVDLRRKLMFLIRNRESNGFCFKNFACGGLLAGSARQPEANTASMMTEKSLRLANNYWGQPILLRPISRGARDRRTSRSGCVEFAGACFACAMRSVPSGCVCLLLACSFNDGWRLCGYRPATSTSKCDPSNSVAEAHLALILDALSQRERGLPSTDRATKEKHNNTRLPVSEERFSSPDETSSSQSSLMSGSEDDCEGHGTVKL